MTKLTKNKNKQKLKLEYKNLEMDDLFLKEMEQDILLQAFSGIVKSESYVELYEIMDGIHKSLMELN